MESEFLLSTPRTLNVLRRRRRTTDVIPLIVFAVFLLLWISVASYAYSTGDNTQVIPPNVVMRIFDTLTVTRIFIVLGFGLLAGLFSLSVLSVFQHVPNVTTAILGVFWIPFTVSITFTIFYPDSYLILVTVGAFCSTVLSLVLVYTEWFYLPEALLKETCKAIRFFPTALFFSIVWYFLCILVFVYAITVQLYLNQIIESEKPMISPILANIFILINVTGFIWLFLFIWNVGQMALCGIFATWFWTVNKDDIPNNIFVPCLKYVVRYHLGTIAYGTSIFGISRVLCTLLKYIVETYRQGVNIHFVLFFICNLFDCTVLRFVLCNSIIMSSMYGKKFNQSVEDTLGCLLKHSKRCLIATKSMEFILLLVAGFVMFFMFFAVDVYIIQGFAPDQQLIIVVPTFLVSMVFVLPTFALIITGMNTILFCTLDDFERNDDSPERPRHMSPELRGALLAEGPPNWYRNCRPCPLFL